VVARAAVHAAAAGDRGRDDDPVADAEVAHLRAECFDDPDRFVAEDGAIPHRAHRAADEVQVGPADRAGGNPDHRVGRIADAGIGDLLKGDLPDAVPDDSLHGTSHW